MTYEVSGRINEILSHTDAGAAVFRHGLRGTHTPNADHG
jgi:hypothetical protein